MPSNFLGRELSVCGGMLKWCRLVFGLSSIYSIGVWVGCLTWDRVPFGAVQGDFRCFGSVATGETEA